MGGLGRGLSERNGYGVVRQGRVGVKRQRGWFCRQKGRVDSGKFSLISSNYRVLGCPSSPAGSINNGGVEMVEDDGVGAHDSYDMHQTQASRDNGMGERDSSPFNKLHDEKCEEKKFSSDEEVKDRTLQEVASNVGEKYTIEFLGKALKEQRASCSSLYLELEKERSAAATAAEEAMAMILRLQEEKAHLEMEARQYQRIIEEKSAYDAEEMNILKEILVRREREKHFLEKEVEAYRQMIHLAIEELPDDGRDRIENGKQPLRSVIDPPEDPVQMLQQLSASIDKQTGIKDNVGEKFQEKETVSTGCKFGVTPQDGRRSESFPPSCGIGIVEDHNFPEKTIPIVAEEEIQDACLFGQGLVENNFETRERTGARILEHGNDLEEHRSEAFKETEDSCALKSEKDLQVLDIHVIPDGHDPCASLEDTTRSNLCSESSRKQRLDTIRDFPDITGLNSELDIHRSTSDVTGELPPVCPRMNSPFSDLRRHSTSAMDVERLKIGYEVEWLRERLKSVQEGREKLNLSREHRERGKVHLKLLEDISHQLQEIRQLTESEKTERRTSLPPSSAKVMPKKRRCRSISSGVQKCS